MPRTIYHARWIVPVTTPPIENGRLIVENDRIISIDRNTIREASAIDLGDAIIVAGFVNAHTHLELTCCQGRAPYRDSFAGWIERLIMVNPRRAPGDLPQRSVDDGFKLSMAAGVTTLADIGSGPQVLEQWRHSPINTVGFIELLGMGPMLSEDHERSMARVAEICQSLSDIDGGEVLRRVGISPHSPFSTDTSLYQEAVDYAGLNRRLICTHLAETREEDQFLADGSGPLRELMERLGLWDGSFKPPGCSAVEYARQVGLLECDPLLVHVNYVDDGDLDLLMKYKCSVAFCPRSHRFFQHEPHRYRDMLARGINVCLGTDSLASNQSLSILDELRFLHSEDRAMDNRQLLSLGTIAGARALKLDEKIGSLEPGKRADFAVIPLDNSKVADPVADILESDRRPVSVYVNGKVAFPGC